MVTAEEKQIQDLRIEIEKLKAELEESKRDIEEAAKLLSRYPSLVANSVKLFIEHPERFEYKETR